MLSVKEDIGRDGFDKTKPENIKTKEYSWPYSQPRILNTIKASSLVGMLLGFFTIFPVITGSYFESKLWGVDFVFSAALVFYMIIFAPLVRRNIIKNVASERRKVVLYTLVAIFTVFYSSVIRFSLSFAKFATVVDSTDFQGFFLELNQNISNLLGMDMLLISLAVAILPTFLFLVPADVNVLQAHNRFVRVKKFEKVEMLNTYEKNLNERYKEPKRFVATVEKNIDEKPKTQYIKPFKEEEDNPFKTEKPTLKAKKAEKVQKAKEQMVMPDASPEDVYKSVKRKKR